MNTEKDELKLKGPQIVWEQGSLRIVVAAKYTINRIFTVDDQMYKLQLSTTLEKLEFDLMEKESWRVVDTSENDDFLSLIKNIARHMPGPWSNWRDPNTWVVKENKVQINSQGPYR